MRSKTICRCLFAVVFVITGTLVWFSLLPVSQAADVQVTVDTDILDPVDAVVEKAVEPILTEVVRAREAVEEMKRIGEEAVKIEEAVRNLDQMEIRLENARLEVTARNAGLPVDEVRAMRSRGIGWGVIAQELGLHPGTLGVGHSKKGVPKTKIKTPKGKPKTKVDKKKGKK